MIDAGYLYIAQPPLYGIRKNNKLAYIKDEVAMNEFLLKSCSSHACIINAAGEVTEKYLLITLKTAQKQQYAFQEFGKFGDAFYMHLAHNNNIAEHLNAQFPNTQWTVDTNEDVICITETENAWIKQHKFSLERLKSREIANAIKLDTSNIYKDARLMFGKTETMIYGPVSLYNTAHELEKTKHSLQRFKGLGEMQAEQLWETTMNPAARTLLRVTIEHAQEAERALVELMGQEVTTRRSMIEDCNLQVRDMDV